MPQENPTRDSRLRRAAMMLSVLGPAAESLLQGLTPLQRETVKEHTRQLGSAPAGERRALLEGTAQALRPAGPGGPGAASAPGAGSWR